MGSIPQGPPASLIPAQVNYAESAQYRQVVQAALMDARCATPGFLVEDMNVAQQTVRVQIAVQERVRTPSGAQWWDVPPIVNVPIIVPRGGGYSITMPLKKGDSGLLVFCDTCFDLWWQNGTEGAPLAANLKALGAQPSGSQVQFEVRRHYVHDCGFIPGMWSQKQLLSDYSSDSLQIRSDDGETIIDVSESGVAITGAAVAVANGGVPLALVNDTFFQWFVNELMPFLVSQGFSGSVPLDSETTILKGQ